MRILLVGDLDDLSAAYVGWLADQRGVEVVPLAESQLGDTWSFSFDDLGDEARGGELRFGERRLPFATIHGAFVRLNPKPTLPNVLEGLEETAAGVFLLERRYGLQLFLEALPCPVINRPRAGRANGSKPYQMTRLERIGMRVPRWSVTNRPANARRFVESCARGAIVKSCSGLRSRVRRADERLFERLEGSAPVLLQDYIAGSDARLHVVGEQTFATRIESAGGIDYRFDGEENVYTAIDAPEEIRELAKRATRAESLELSGIDFRIDENGEWWCLEVNPVPTFLPYEAAAAHPIADTVLERMAELSGQWIGPRMKEMPLHAAAA